MFMKYLFSAFCLSLLLLLASCVTEPVTGRQQLIVSSVGEELEQSAKLWDETLKLHKPSPYSDLKWLNGYERG